LKKVRILIVEDEKKLAGFLKKGLQQEGFSVDWAATGEEALDRTLDGSADLIILDLNLPGPGGLSILKSLRDEGDATPVLILTARDSVDDKVKGLEMGANDYLTKPFAFKELVARVKVLLRSPANVADVLRADDLVYDAHSRRVTRGSERISLTNKEAALLEALLRARGRPVSRVRLWEHAWDGSFEVDSNVLDVHIARLRRKIDAGRKMSLIETVHGIGYKIEADTAKK
jgi:DNA-binding response OmpR family regulator